ncbi:MAG: chromate resistance protein ChrB domain-containing protein [Promethearchaeota archaeon]
MKWVTRVKPHVDRCASMWLIQKFVDPKAEFAFVPREYKWEDDEIPLVLPGAELSPKESKTAFELIIAKYQIADPIVHQIAKIIHDIEQAENSGIYHLPESKGIFIVLRGIDPSAQDDHETLKTALKVMDAIYVYLLKTAQGEKLS